VAFSFPFFILAILHFLLKKISNCVANHIALYTIDFYTYIIIDFYLTLLNSRVYVSIENSSFYFLLHSVTKCYDIETHSQRYSLESSLYRLRQQEVHLLFFLLMRYSTRAWTSVYHIYLMFKKQDSKHMFIYEKCKTKPSLLSEYLSIQACVLIQIILYYIDMLFTSFTVERYIKNILILNQIDCNNN